MESVPQATQREITLASLALVKASRPEVQARLAAERELAQLRVQQGQPRRKRPRGGS